MITASVKPLCGAVVSSITVLSQDQVMETTSEQRRLSSATWSSGSSFPLFLHWPKEVRGVRSSSCRLAQIKTLGTSFACSALFALKLPVLSGLQIWLSWFAQAHIRANTALASLQVRFSGRTQERIFSSQALPQISQSPEEFVISLTLSACLCLLGLHVLLAMLTHAGAGCSSGTS